MSPPRDDEDIAQVLGEADANGDRLEELLSSARRHIRTFAVLPVDPEADARFGAFAKRLVRRIPRRVLTRRVPSSDEEP